MCLKVDSGQCTSATTGGFLWPWIFLVRSQSPFLGPDLRIADGDLRKLPLSMVTTATLIAVEIVRKNPDQVGFAVNPRTPEARISPNAIFSIFLGALAAISESWIRFSHLETVGRLKRTTGHF